MLPIIICRLEHLTVESRNHDPPDNAGVTDHETNVNDSSSVNQSNHLVTQNQGNILSFLIIGLCEFVECYEFSSLPRIFIA